jgi:hypothetical protein
MRLELVPFDGVGPVRLGMTRAQVLDAMETPPHTFAKWAAGPPAPDVDAFLGSAFQAFYDVECWLETGDLVVDFIELSRGPEVEPWLEGISVFQIPANELVSRLTENWSFDAQDPELGHSYVFPAIGLLLWRPMLPEDELDPEGRYFSTVAIASKGYLDSRHV